MQQRRGMEARVGGDIADPQAFEAVTGEPHESRLNDFRTAVID